MLMSMPYDRRLQLLLDEQRYALVEGEARRSGRSVAAVIREAIDQRFASESQSRSAAAWRLLAIEPGSGTEPDWADIKASFEQDLVDRFP